MDTLEKVALAGTVILVVAGVSVAVYYAVKKKEPPPPSAPAPPPPAPYQPPATESFESEGSYKLEFSGTTQPASEGLSGPGVANYSEITWTDAMGNERKLVSKRLIHDVG